MNLKEKLSKSISTQLALICVLASLLTGLASTFFHLRVLESNLFRDAEELLKTRLNSVCEVLIQARGATPEFHAPTFLIHQSGIYLRIWDEKNQLREESPGAADIFPTEFKPIAAATPHPSAENPQRITTPQGSHYLLLSRVLFLGERNTQPLTIQIALNIDPQVMILERQKFYHIILLIFGATFTLTLLWSTQRIALRPIAELEKSTASLESEATAKILVENYPIELRSLASSLNRLHQKFREQLDSLRSFTHNIAHEVRNPLNIMIGEAELTLSAPRSAHEYRATIESYLDESKELARLADRLLFLARADNQAESLQVEPVEISPLIQDLVDFYTPLADEKKSVITISGDPTLSFPLDRMLMGRAIGNLLGNAILHTPPGTQIQLHFKKTDRNLVIEVEDNGPGVPLAERQRIFDRFYTRNTGQSYTHKSTGLGLPICQTIVRLHGGTISAETSTLGGICFRMTLPQLN